MRVLITGSRGWASRPRIERALDMLHLKGVVEVPTVPTAPFGALVGIDVLVSGHCPRGADLMAEDWAIQHGVRVEAHPAAWRSSGVYRPSAGLDRNTLMAELGADVCLAFAMRCQKPQCRGMKVHGSHGAMHCAGEAQRMGIPTALYTSGWAP